MRGSGPQFGIFRFNADKSRPSWHAKEPGECWSRVLIAEADAFVAMWKDEKLSDGRDRIVRHGHGRITRSRPGTGLWKSVAPMCAISHPAANPRLPADER